MTSKSKPVQCSNCSYWILQYQEYDGRVPIDVGNCRCSKANIKKAVTREYEECEHYEETK